MDMAGESATEHERTEQPPWEVIPEGGDVDFTDDDKTYNFDRIEILPGGMVKLINKADYSKVYRPVSKVEGIYTHTSTEEEEDWW